MTTEPVVKELVVPAEPEAAFRRFTEEMDLWWPRETHSVFEAESASVTMEAGVGGRLVERARSGETCEWGRVTTWAPPRSVAFTWHPGREPDGAQAVEVTFTQVEGGTRVRLVHSGWDRLGDAAVETRAGYDPGWDRVLARFQAGLAEA